MLSFRVRCVIYFELVKYFQSHVCNSTAELASVDAFYPFIDPFTCISWTSSLGSIQTDDIYATTPIFERSFLDSAA